MIVERGIDTIAYHMSLTPKQKQNIMEKIKNRKGFLTLRDDYWSDVYSYASNCNADQGIKIHLDKKRDAPWNLLILVHPTLLLGETDRSALFFPTKRNYAGMVKRADELLKKICVPCSLESMKLYRVDVTENWVCADAETVDTYLRIIKKGFLIPHYKLDWFRSSENKAKNPSDANRHSYKQKCKRAAFFAYDKTAQLQMIDHFPKALIGKKVLRLEVQMRRKSFSKWVGKAKMESNYTLLKTLCKQERSIIKWYLKRMKLLNGDIVRYEDAVELVSTFRGKKARERMVYLLRKTSDSRDLTSAIEKLKEKYHLNGRQVANIFKKFAKLGISPITLPNTSETKRLSSIESLLYG